MAEPLSREQQELVESHRDFGLMLARPFVVKSPGLRGLINAAADYGLVRAAQRYDAKRGLKFSTFSARFIVGKIIDDLRRESRQGYGRGNGRLKLVAVGSAPRDDRAYVSPEIEYGLDCILGSLPERMRAMMVLVHKDGMSVTEAGRSLGLSRKGYIHKEFHAANELTRRALARSEQPCGLRRRSRERDE
jgi:RNA polymerase sigma factor (sigma-70 family)